VGVFDRDRIVQAVRCGSRAAERARGDRPVYSAIAGSAAVASRERKVDAAGYFESDAARLRLTPRHYAYLRVSEGCNQNCTFCTIPGIRGKMRSKPVDSIVAEARELFADGAFELNLIGQDTTSFGRDIGYEPGLAGLLEALDQVAAEEGGRWLRLMYAYPSSLTDEMIDAIAGLPSLVKYLDIPLQHIDDTVLTRMRRSTSRALIERLLDRLRQRIDGLAIRTTFISGFPGETDAQHAELVEFVRQFGFDAMGVFAFSPEPGTPAHRLHADGHAVPDEVTQERVDELMLAQQQVAFAANDQAARRGDRVSVLMDGPSAPDDAPAAAGYVGRTARQAPEVDGCTFVESATELAPGELVRCQVVDWRGYDLVARPAAELDTGVSLPIVDG